MWSERLVLGTASLGLDGRDAAFELLDEYVRLGGRVIDTAAIYSDWVPGETGRSEAVIGEWMASRANRDSLTIVTKGGHPLIGTTKGRLDAAAIRTDVELSLKRLGTDRIDLWFLHKNDASQPVPEIVATLQELHRQGKILAFGSSNWPVSRMDEALAVPGVTFSSNQVLGNVFARLIAGPPDPTNLIIDSAMFRHAIDNRMSLFLYSATAHGYFQRRAAGRAPAREYDNPAVAKAAQDIEAIASELGVDPSDMIVAYLLQLADPVRAIIGPRTAEQLRGMWRAAETTVPVPIIRRIAAAAGMSDFMG